MRLPKIPNPKFRRSINANLAYWQSAIKRDGSKEFFQNNAGNLAQALEFGLSSKNSFPGSVELLIQLHPIVLETGKSGDWLRFYERATKAPYDFSKNPSLYSNLLNQLGSLYWQTGRNANSLIAFRKAYRITTKHKLIHQQVAASLGMCLSYWASREYEKAWQQADIAYQDWPSLAPDDPLKRSLLAALGTVAYALKEYTQAEKYFRKALKHCAKKDEPEQRHLKTALALCLYVNNEFERALKQLAGAAIMIRGSPGNERELLQIELLAAAVHYRMGNLDRANEILKRVANSQGFQAEDYVLRAFLESSLGRVQHGLGNSQDAVAFLESAAILWEREGNVVMLVDTLRLLGQIGFA